MERVAALGVVLIALLSLAIGSEAAAWRLFAGREECISEYIPEAQWEAVRPHNPDPAHAQALVDIGFLVTSRYGTEETKATVDFTLYDPLGRTLHFEESVGSSEVAMTGSGGRGPWRACFKVSRRQILRPSVIVRLSYFTVNSPTLIGTHFEWQRGQHADAGATKPDAAAALAASEVKPEQLGTAEQVTALMEGLQRLDFYLHNVTNEQRYLSSRSDRHLRTVRSTHARALWYNLAVYAAIVLAAFAQVVGTRLMFRNRRKQGIII